jgi:hypothetical protein
VSGPQRWGTHGVEFAGDRVVKRFRRGARAEGAREWRALTLLHRHAPGLAPAPAVRQVHAAVPPSELVAVPPRQDGPADCLARIRDGRSRPRAQDGPLVRKAVDAGVHWLDGEGERRLLGADAPSVFGCGDGNLANYLWDGSRVRVVDFEDSGRSDRPFELAEITEHVGSWVEHPLDVPAFLGHADLTPAESARLTDCRRLVALVWLFLLACEEPAQRRNPPGTVDRQAERVLTLLG